MFKTLSKRNIYIISIFILLLLVFVVVLIFRGGGNVPQSLESSIYAFSENNEMFIKKTNSEIFEKITRAKTLVFEGYTVKTTNSYAHIELANSSFISISPFSEMVIKISNEKKTKIEQIIGNSWHRVQSLSGKTDASYEVDTKEIQASVKGTEFAVMTTNEGAHIFVNEGVVKAKNNQGQVDLLANDYLIADQNELKKTKPSDEFLESNFFKRNLEIKKGNTKDFDVIQYASDMIDGGLYDFDREFFRGFNSTEEETVKEEKTSASSSSQNSSQENQSNQIPALRLPTNRSSSASASDISSSFSASSSITNSASSSAFSSSTSSFKSIESSESSSNSSSEIMDSSSVSSSSRSITNENNQSSITFSQSSESIPDVEIIEYIQSKL